MPGHVEKRSAGSWLLIYDVGRDQDGKRKRITKTIKTKNSREAEKELTRFIVQYDQGLYIEPSKMNFGEYLEKWLEGYAKQRVSVRTYSFYEQMFKLHTIPRLGHIPLEKLRPLQLQEYYNFLTEEGRKDGKKGGLAPASVFKHHCIIHKALKTAVKWELLNKNPADAVEVPKKKRSKVSFYTSEQAQLMLSLAKATSYYPVLVIAVYVGLRRGEIFGLGWSNIDWDNSLMKIRRTVQYTPETGIFFKEPKTESGNRDIRISGLVIEVLKQHRIEQNKKKLMLGKSYQDNDLIFCQNDGKPIHPDTISRWFPKFLTENKLPKIRFHDLRHTNATMLLEGNVPDLEIAERLGHADPSTPKRIYGHVTPDMQRRSVDTIDRAMAKLSK